MLKKIFNLKVFLLGALFTMIFSSLAFASDVKTVSYGTLKNNSNVAVATNWNGVETNYLVFVSSSPSSKFNYSLCDVDNYDGCCVTEGGQKFKVYCYSYRNDFKNANEENKLSDNLKFKYLGEYDSYKRYGSLDFNYSTNDIIGKSSHGDDYVFFSAKPIPSITAVAKELPKSVIKQMGIILPVGISALCLVVLVPYLVLSIKRFV